jgi:asparagine synthase (glutamine-hydrolysing)
MLGVLRHRGPDDSGCFSDSTAWIGHQPMANEDSTVRITYNGELFNHASLRPELQRAGHRYQTNCGTEAILHAHERHGVECVRRFRGMFAFAVWDQRRKRLFAFASEIKALLEHPSISAGLEASLLPEYLAFGFTSGERTLFAGIRKLMPGHTPTLELEDGAAKLDIERYWDVPEHGPGERRPDEDWIRECGQRLEETVRMRPMSDVPLGVFLSGGVDSSAITALVKRRASGPVETLAVGYREVTVSMQEFFEALPRSIWHEDEPIAWPCSVSLYFVSKLASERVKVAPTGEGSDELFAGYSRYRFYLLNRRWAAAWRLLPAGLRRRIRGWVAETRLLPAGLRRKLRHTPVGQGEALESLYLDNFYSAFPASEQAGLPGSDQSDEPYRNFLGYWNARTGASLVERMLYADQKTYPVELPMKQDQMSMATSIESRVPFLDHPFVEFSARAPQRLKIRGRTAKYILKRAVEDLLPADIIHRRKMGFPTPLREWLRRPEAAPLLERLGYKHGLRAEYLDRSAVALQQVRHKNGWEDATDRIGRLLNLQLWGDIFITGRGGRGAFESAAPTLRTP